MLCSMLALPYFIFCHSTTITINYAPAWHKFLGFPNLNLFSHKMTSIPFSNQKMSIQHLKITSRIILCVAFSYLPCQARYSFSTSPIFINVYFIIDWFIFYLHICLSPYSLDFLTKSFQFTLGYICKALNYLIRNKDMSITGAPRWLSQLSIKLLISAYVMISGS